MIVQAFLRALSGGGGISSVTGTFPINVTAGANPVVSITEVLPQTVAQMQALASGSGFIAGLTYQITDAYSGAAVINIKAFSTSVLEDYGFGTFQNGAMSASVKCFMWYDLTSDKIKRIYDPVNENDVRNSFGNVIDFFLFDSWTGNTVIEADISFASDPGNTLTNCFLYPSSVINFSGSTSVLSGCIFESGSSLTTYGTQALTSCRLGVGKTMDLSGVVSTYSATGKVYDGDRSTFEVTSSDDPAVNPDISNTIDMNNFKWAGILITAGAHVFSVCANYPTDHDFRVQSSESFFIINDVNHALGGNIMLLIDGSQITLDAANSDWVSFRVACNDVMTIQSIIQRVQT